MAGRDGSGGSPEGAAQSLRETFNSAAARYHRARPGYPVELFDDLIELTGIGVDSAILEIGPGTGKATQPLAARGLSIHGIELGADLAREARRNLAAYPNVTIEVGNFESVPIQARRYDVVMSATAYHWIRQPIGFQRVAAALRSGGYFVEFRHHHVWSAESEPFYNETQEVYLNYGPGDPSDHRLPLPDEVETLEQQIVDTGLFEPPAIRRYRQDIVHTPESYVDLLLTFSDHIAQSEPHKTQLLDGLADIIRSLPKQQAIKTHLIVLHVARLKD